MSSKLNFETQPRADYSKLIPLNEETAASFYKLSEDGTTWEQPFIADGTFSDGMLVSMDPSLIDYSAQYQMRTGGSGMKYDELVELADSIRAYGQQSTVSVAVYKYPDTDLGGGQFKPGEIVYRLTAGGRRTRAFLILNAQEQELAASGVDGQPYTPRRWNINAVIHSTRSEEDVISRTICENIDRENLTTPEMCDLYVKQVEISGNQKKAAETMRKSQGLISQWMKIHKAVTEGGTFALLFKANAIKMDHAFKLAGMSLAERELVCTNLKSLVDAAIIKKAEAAAAKIAQDGEKFQTLLGQGLTAAQAGEVLAKEAEAVKQATINEAQSQPATAGVVVTGEQVDRAISTAQSKLPSLSGKAFAGYLRQNFAATIVSPLAAQVFSSLADAIDGVGYTNEEERDTGIGALLNQLYSLLAPNHRVAAQVLNAPVAGAALQGNAAVAPAKGGKRAAAPAAKATPSAIGPSTIPVPAVGIQSGPIIAGPITVAPVVPTAVQPSVVVPQPPVQPIQVPVVTAPTTVPQLPQALPYIVTPPVAAPPAPVVPISVPPVTPVQPTPPVPPKRTRKSAAQA